MRPVVVIGAGLSGLATALELQRAGRPVVVLERELEAGGACRSITEGGFTFDFTGHLLHIANPSTRQMLAELGVAQELEEHSRNTAVMVGGHLTPYPIQINTHGLAPEVRRDCLLGFIRAWATAPEDEPASFREWVLTRFGEGLARSFFFPYNSKLFRTPPEALTTEWVGRFVPRPRLEEVVDGALGLHDRPVGYNATFCYPVQGGIRMLPDALARRVSDLRLGAEVVMLNPQERWVELAGGERLAYSEVVFTGSLPRLFDLLPGPLPAPLAVARQQLRWVAVLNVALGVDGPCPRVEHWIYFPDPELPFYRVGFPSNHGRLAPDGCHTVSIEISLDPAGADVAAVGEAAEEALARLGLLDRQRVRLRLLNLVDPAYVVYDRQHGPALATLRAFLAAQGVLTAGRWAEWKYSAMEDALTDGQRAAQAVLRAGEPAR